MTPPSRLQLEPLSTIELNALLALAQADSSAYGVALSVAVDAHDQFRPTVNGVTTAFTRMMARGWIEIHMAGRTRHYRLSDWGRQQLVLELDRLSEVVAVGRERLKPGGDTWNPNDMIEL